MELHTRTDLLNYLIERYGLKSYLEIGVQNRVNFDKIACNVKIGVDPNEDTDFMMTSDEYFETQNNPFDLIFIDGLHTDEQAKRDFENALRCLNDHGFIVLHDCLPTEEKYTTVPRETKIWYGTVYKFAMTLCNYDGISYATWNNDCGCCVVWKSQGKSKQVDIKLTWENYSLLGITMLNATNNIESYLP